MQETRIKYYNEEKPIRATLMDMAIDDVIVFPVGRISTVRVTASALNLQVGRKYSTKSSRKDMTLKVKRLA